MTTAKETIIEKILTDLPIASCRGEMTKEEWRGWFEEAFEKGEKYASQSKWDKESLLKELKKTSDAFLIKRDYYNAGLINKAMDAIEMLITIQLPVEK